jgi:hypothetical protein
MIVHIITKLVRDNQIGFLDAHGLEISTHSSCAQCFQ